ncbi:MAG TPA: MnhB domain-containing protein [Stellaceae bacterium]|jgi:multicomponent Na+:H+ antiporter subunit B
MRLVLAALGCLGLLPAVWKIASALPPFGYPTGPYGPAVNRLGPSLRHVANMISAVNFDFRGLDTLGEELMLVAAVTGAVLLLRGIRGQDLGARPATAGRPLVQRAESTVLISRLLGPVALLFGYYMAMHGMTTPGGGFQGGVALASGLLLLYMGEGYRPWRRLMRSPILAAAEGGGALVFALAGFLPMVEGKAFMENVLPLGTIRDVFSGGLMLIENGGVGLAVAGGFAMLFLEFLEETRALDDEEPG